MRLRHAPPRTERPEPDPPWLLILAGLLIMGSFAPGACELIGVTRRGLASLAWVKTRGVVIRTGLARSQFAGSDRKYSLKVIYRYTVEGREYQDDCISFPERRDVGDEAYYRKELNREYPTDRPCMVYYNPGNPAESCLEPGVSVFLVVLMFCIPLQVFFGMYHLEAGIRGLRHGRAAGKAPEEPGLDSSGGLWDLGIDGWP
jgi:hypothetical protein